MKSVAKVVCLFCVVVMASLLTSACASRRLVEQTNMVDRVGERVSQSDTLVSKVRQDRHDSVAVVALLQDSIVEQVSDSVCEVVTVDTAGRIISREVWHNTSRNRDHYRIADRKTASVSNTQREDSVKTSRNYASLRDSSLIIGTSKITEIHENESNPVTRVRNAVLKVVGMVALVLLFALILSAWFYMKFKGKS